MYPVIGRHIVATLIGLCRLGKDEADCAKSTDDSGSAIKAMAAPPTGAILAIGGTLDWSLTSWCDT